VGYDVDLKTNRLRTETTVVEALGTWKPLVELKASVFKDEIGFRSYDVVEVELENTHSYYVPTELFLSETREIEFLDDNHRLVLLRPFEKKKEAFLFKLKNELISNYVYNFTVKAYTIRNASSITNFFSSEDYKVYRQDDMMRYIEETEEEAEKTYSREVGLSCISDKEVYYVTEKAVISCTIHNTGNVALDGVDICIVDDCQKITLGIGQKKVHKVEQYVTEGGKEDILITAENPEVTKSASVQFEVWERPYVHIMDLTYPDYVSLEDKFTVEFRVGPNASSIPQNVNIMLSTSTFEKEWKIDELEQNRKYILNVEEYTLSDVRNAFKLLVTYTDNMGRRYSNSEDFVVELTDITLKQRVAMLLNKINVQLRYDMIVVVIAVFVAGIVIGLIFRVRSDK